MTVLLAAAFLSLGLVNLDFSRNWWRGQRLRLIVGVPIVLLFAYVQMPPLVFPQAFSLLLLTLVPNAAYGLLLSARNIVVSRRIVSIRRTPLWPYLLALAVLFGWSGILVAAPVVDAGGLRDIPGAVVSRISSVPYRKYT